MIRDTCDTSSVTPDEDSDAFLEEKKTSPSSGDTVTPLCFQRGWIGV